MLVPQNLCLSNQTFNSKFLEFVWQFPHTEEEQYQVIFKAFKDGGIYIESGVIDNKDVYKLNGEPELSLMGITSDWLRSDMSTTTIDYIKRYFTFEELAQLADDVIKYLNEL